MKKIPAIILVLVLTTRCGNLESPVILVENKVDSISLQKSDNGTQKPKTTPSTKVYDSITKNIGFVGLKKTEYKLDFFNLDKSHYKKVSFFEIKNDKNFEPYAYHSDYYLLWFRCVKAEKGFYTVVINETSKKCKFLKISPNKLEFLTWEKLVLHSASIDFDFKNNPLRKEISDKSEIINYNKDELYYPVEINGDWLKVQWGQDSDSNYGWIKWKEKNKFLLELFFFA